jgi:hypothetical protein|nr:MAG TPA: hypothetical protein [Caudoviricetes sp.]
MSVKRYSVGVDGVDPNGNLVKYTDYAALEARCAALAAENAWLKDINAWCKTDAFKNMYREFKTAEALGCHDVDCMHDAMLTALMHAPKTPATDAFLAEVRAQGVDGFLRGSQLPYQIATVLADYDNVDDATLQTVIWSGQPPEPDGDVWHLEYVSRGNAIVRSVLNELRKGVI